MPRPNRLVIVVATLIALTQALAQPATTISLQVGGGPFQGSYSVTSEDPTCTYGYAGEGIWGNQYSIDATSDDEFSSLQLIVDARSAAQGTGAFLTTISFGPLFTPAETSYTVSTRGDNEEGSGTLVLDDRDDSATVTISAVTSEGIPIEATIECHTVLRSGAPVMDLAAPDEPTEGEPAGPLSMTVGSQSFEFLPTIDEAYCAEGLGESNDFQYNFYPYEADGEITGAEVYIYDTRRLGPDAEFYLAIYTTDDGYYIDTAEGAQDGSGTIQFEERGDERTVTVSATTADGLPVEVRLECRTEE